MALRARAFFPPRIWAPRFWQNAFPLLVRDRALCGSFALSPSLRGACALLSSLRSACALSPALSGAVRVHPPCS